MLVYGKYQCFVMHMLYVCVLCASCGSSQCCILHDLQFVKTGRGCKKQPYGCRVWSEQSASFLSGFSVRLFRFVQATTLCRYGCMYFLTALVLVCVDVMVMSSA